MNAEWWMGTRTNGYEGAGSAHCWNTLMVVRQGSPLVGINCLGNEEYGGGGDRRSLVAGWLKNGRKRGRIAAKCGDVAKGDREHGGSHGWSQNVDLDKGKLSGWSDYQYVARRHQKMARMLAVAVETCDKNTLSISYCGIARVGYGSKACHEGVMGVLKTHRWLAKVTPTVWVETLKIEGNF